MPPQRTREHELEDESSRAFAATIPSEWVVRDIPKDYGLDCEVEIFENGEATGLMFKVQLKATDTLHGRPPRRSIKLSHLDYWRRLEIPVLVVLYVADSQTLYAKWSFAHDPGIGGYSQKTTSFKFGEEDRLESRLGSLPGEVGLYRSIAAGHMPRPVGLSIESKNKLPSDWSWFESLRNAIAEHELGDIVSAVAPGTGLALSVCVDDKAIRLELPLNAASMSLHRNQGFHFDTADMLDIVFSMIAAQLAQRDRSADALQILSAVGPNASWLLGEVAARLCAAFEAEHEHSLPLAVSEWLLNQPLEQGRLYLATMYAQTAKASLEWMDEDDLSLLLDALEGLHDAYIQLGLPEHAALQKVSRAGVFSERNDYHSAVRELEQARHVSPKLDESPGFTNVLASNLFRDGQYALAVAAYEHVVELGAANEPILSCLADSYLFSGNFAECLRIVDGARGEPLRDRLSVVNRLACHEIMDMTGLSCQETREYTDEEIELVESDPESNALRLLTTVNALAFRPWFLLSSESHDWSLGRAVLLGRLALSFAPGWAVASILAYHEIGLHSPELEAIVETAVIDARDDYFDLLDQFLSAVESDEEKSHITDIRDLAQQLSLKNSDLRMGMRPYAGRPMPREERTGRHAGVAETVNGQRHNQPQNRPV